MTPTTLSPDEVVPTSFHEAGHVICARALGIAVARVSLRGAICPVPVYERNDATLRKKLVIAWAGPTSEINACGYSLDEQLHMWATCWARDQENIRVRLKLLGEASVGEREAAMLVARHWAAIEQVAAMLVTGAVLDGNDIDAVLWARQSRRCA